jgi:hypothetical protein
MARIPMIFFNLRDWQENREKVVALMKKNIKIFKEAHEEVLKEKTELKGVGDSNKKAYQTAK